MISASIGIAFFPEDDADVERLLKKAEAAMRRVKRAGGDGYLCYSPAMDETPLEQALHRRGEKR